jgi:hypothetical protein
MHRLRKINTTCVEGPPSLIDMFVMPAIAVMGNASTFSVKAIFPYLPGDARSEQLAHGRALSYARTFGAYAVEYDVPTDVLAMPDLEVGKLRESREQGDNAL